MAKPATIHEKPNPASEHGMNMFPFRVLLWGIAQCLQVFAGATLVQFAYAQSGIDPLIPKGFGLVAAIYFCIISGYIVSSLLFSLLRPHGNALRQATRMAAIFAVHAGAFVLVFGFVRPNWVIPTVLIGGGAIAVLLINWSMESVFAHFGTR